MAKRVIWSPLAKRKRFEILEFWNIHDKSKTYSRKLNSLFNNAQKLISQYLGIGTSTDDPKVKHKLIRHYSLFYEIGEGLIIVLTIWDNRQEPDKLTFQK